MAGDDGSSEWHQASVDFCHGHYTVFSAWWLPLPPTEPESVIVTNIITDECRPYIWIHVKNRSSPEAFTPRRAGFHHQSPPRARYRHCLTIRREGRNWKNVQRSNEQHGWQYNRRQPKTRVGHHHTADEATIILRINVTAGCVPRVNTATNYFYSTVITAISYQGRNRYFHR